MALKSLTTIAALCLCLSVVSLSQPAYMAPSTSDWPQWRGPERNGISKESGLLKQWPAGGPKLLWQLNDIGDGYSGPSVVGTRIYLMSNRGMDNEFVQALSTHDGKVIWTTRVGNVSLGRSSVAYAEGLLYVHAWKGDVGLVEATPEGYREKGRFTPPDQPKPPQGAPYADTAYAHPVIANGILYIRDSGTLWAYDIREGR